MTALAPGKLAAKGYCIYCGRVSGRSLACREHRDLLTRDPVLTVARDLAVPIEPCSTPA